MENAPERLQHDTINDQIFDSLASGVLACDGEGAILRVNAAACRHLRLNEGELAPGIELHSIPALTPLLDLLEKLRNERKTLSRVELALQDGGETRFLGITASPLQGAPGFHGAIFLFIDMTEMRRLERLATLNQQLAQIGELTAGVVHELRNPLSVISGLAELLVRKLHEDALKRRAQTIHDEATHMGDLITQFLGFARPFTVNPIPMDALQIVDRAVTLCENLARELQVKFHVAVPNEPVALEADCEKMAQALANILRNAIEAAGDGGAVAFTLINRTGQAVFRCEDTGPGIHLPSNQDIFNAFFTNKPDGTGLGLSIAHRMVAAHNGLITFGNREEGGAWFEVTVPTAAD
ncbi:MAG: PAS domain-containing protein [Candidatus Hydrogenedentes bacterium]|nr:PAS domain-containing protein [Candidatus Hydrogenedentota bacterium]